MPSGSRDRGTRAGQYERGAPGLPAVTPPTEVTVDDEGMAHTKVQQLHRGVPVWEGQAIVHLAQNGKFAHMTDDLKADVAVDTTPDYTADEAIDLAVQAEPGFGHTASMYSRNLDALHRAMGRAINPAAVASSVVTPMRSTRVASGAASAAAASTEAGP